LSNASAISIITRRRAVAEIDLRKSRIIELRFFGGLRIEETALVLQVSGRTVRREWSSAKAWLYAELSASKTLGDP
jgi:RNA polymerase sigma-70 factor (ECF subfamily)